MNAASSVGTSAMGRWTQQDPVGGSLGDLNSANRYAYAGDDPVNATDPSGKCTLGELIFDIILVVALIAIVAGLLIAVAPEIVAASGFLAELLILFSTANGLQLVGAILSGFAAAFFAGFCLASVQNGGR
jgi:hypothetical protein